MTSFNMINASAGSGKTHQITLEFLKLILFNPSETKRILSITFTNKAAGEMKERLINALSELSKNPEECKMTNALLEYFAPKKAEEIKLQAKKTLKYVLHNYSEISISTIDSFMQRIIRTFSRELNLPANYDISVENKDLDENVLNKIIENANRNENITRVLKEIILMQIDDEKNPLSIQHNMLPLISHLSVEASAQIINITQEIGAQNMMSVFDELQKLNKKRSANIYEKINKIEVLFNKHNITNDYFIKKGNATTIYKYINNLKVNFSARPLHQSVYELLEDGRFLTNPFPEVENFVSKTLIEIIEEIDELLYDKMLARRFPVVALLSEILQLREEYKKEQNILPISDFNQIIGEVLTKEPMPFIYMRAGSRYKTIMIDEFQDTSQMQWKNLLPLVLESLSRGNSSWIVGDPKQSIYRWRNGSVEVMLNLPQILNKTTKDNDAEKMLKSAFKQSNLVDNYRSAKNIVDFNSEFYDFLKNNFEARFKQSNLDDDTREKLGVYTRIYSSTLQNVKKQNEGYVECRFYKEKLSKLQTQWLNDIEKVIRNSIEDGYNPNDITIIVRNKKEGATISSYLMGLSNPIAVVSRETLQFQTSPFCRLAMCIFRLIHCPNDDLNAAETFALISVIFKTMDYDDFFNSANNIRGKELLNLFKKKYEKLDVDYLSFMSPADQIDIIIHSLNISKDGGYFLLFLREQIMIQQEKLGYNEDIIWQWWQTKGAKSSVVVPDTENAINIMTIHSAKGLQFPIVIIPYFNINEISNIKKTLFWHYVDKEKQKIPFTLVNYTQNSKYKDISEKYSEEEIKCLIDTLNLMYVATTRAEEKLYLFSFSKSFSDIDDDHENDNSISSNSNSSEHLLFNFININKKQFNVQNHESYVSFYIGNKSKNININTKNDNKLIIENISINPNKPLKTIYSNRRFDSVELREATVSGRAIHEILSNIFDNNDIKPIVDTYTKNGWIKDEEREKYIELFASMINNFSYAFKSKNFVINEREIACKDGKIYRPDRIVYDKDKKWTVIDFKTGIEKKEHLQQVYEYAYLLKEAGFQINASYLIYINTYDFTTKDIKVS